jgi:hypothetical protein
MKNYFDAYGLRTFAKPSQDGFSNHQNFRSNVRPVHKKASKTIAAQIFFDLL